ncbi:MAG: undecaprenyl-diphosphatase UppP [Dehalococcoidia bacterium]
MELLRAAILGIVQGLTEFIPVSSSGHLILVPALFGWDDQGLAFDVGLHLGTLLALLVYFWRDWLRMFGSASRDFVAVGPRWHSYGQDTRLLLALALGSVPVAVVGLLFSGWIEENVRQPWVVAVGLVVAGTVILFVDRLGKHNRSVDQIGIRDALFIGTVQALALIPGVSRSGATITAGVFLDLRRDAAARFGFLLGTPAFVGAALLKSGDLGNAWQDEFDVLALGFVASAVTGFVVIHYLLRYLRTRSLLVFVLYRYVVAALTLLIGGIRVLA